MELFLIQHDNGLEDELRQTKTLGVYDNLHKAITFLVKNGFYESDNDPLFYNRYGDFAIIHPIFLNTPIQYKK